MPPQVPGREAVLESVLRNLSRHETPMRYIAVARIRNFIYALSDVNYERFMVELSRFDPKNINPKIKEKMLADARAVDDTGLLETIVAETLASDDLMLMAKAMLTDLMPIEGHA